MAPSFYFHYLHICDKCDIIELIQFGEGGAQMKQLRLAIDEELHRELKLYAVTNEKKIPDVIIEALRTFLSDKKEESSN